jgi:hypothetical protein
MTRTIWDKKSERMEVQDETLRRPGMQQWHKGLRPKTTTMWSRRLNDLCGRLPLHLENKKTTKGIYWKTIGLEIVNQAVGISTRLRRIRKWTLWRGRPPPKQKKKLCME